ncbi:MAG: peptide transporter, partial [Planctomycetota bacterium]
MKEDAELKQFRELMTPPDVFEDGFGWKAVFGAIFVGLIMTPASMYMQLVVGQDVGGAAQWVTVILFIEVAR